MSDIETIILKIISKYEAAEEAALDKESRRCELNLHIKEMKIERLQREVEELKGRLKSKDSEEHPRSPIRGV